MTPERLDTIKRVLDRKQNDLTVMLENVIKPHNLAAVARTLEAVGGMEIHAITERTSIRLSQMSAGGVRRWVQVRKYGTTEEGVCALKERGFRVFATTLNDASIDYREVDYTQPCAILMGEEYEGITEEAVSMADECIKIPIVGMVQSLNVSVAAALILYEAYRQREASGRFEQRSLDDDTYYRMLFEACHPQVARYCKQKNLPYPKIDEDAELLEPVADSTTHGDDDYVSWMRKQGL